MKRILFVDDEPLVLDGLRDVFRKQRREWDMVFAPGGREALDLLSGHEFDVIVSDMRMPTVDGNAVMAAAREQQPAAARVILSGHAGREAELLALTVAHQFVSKPCEPAVLRGIIERACGLQALLSNPALRRIVGRLDRLPSPPTLYFELTKATARQDVTMAELATLVEQDPAMTAKVLQFVNSAVFGSARPQTSVQQALVYLGVQRLKALTLTAQVFMQAERGRLPFNLDVQQRHSARVALLAQQFFRDPQRAETAFTAGLLHEVGKVVLAMAMPEAAAELPRVCDTTTLLPHEAEPGVFGTTHADAGAYLLALWGLPLEIVEAVQFHHEPARAATDIVVAVHVADALLYESHPPNARPPKTRLDEAFLAASPYADRLPQWRTLASAFTVQ